MPKKLLPVFILTIFAFSVTKVDAVYTCTPGKVVSPGQNIADVANSASSGDTICIKEGTYSINGTYTITKSGINIVSHPDNTNYPKIESTGTYSNETKWRPAISVKGDNVNVDGIEIAGSPGRGFVVGEARNINVKNLIVHDTYATGIMIINSDNVTIDGFKAYKLSQLETIPCNQRRSIDNCNHPESVLIVDSRDAHFTNGIIYNVMGGTFSSARTVNTSLTNSHIYDNTRSLIHLDQATNVRVENNLAYISSNNGGFNSRSGLIVYDEVYWNHTNDKHYGKTYDYSAFHGGGRTIKNNILINTRVGINLGCEYEQNQQYEDGKGPSDDTCRFKDDIVENNIVLNNYNYQDGTRTVYSKSLEVNQNKVEGTNSIKNNIFHHKTPTKVFETAVNLPGVFGVNVWSGTPQGLSGQQVKTDAQIKAMFKYPDKAFNQSNHKPGQVDPAWFELKDEFKQFGADVTKVGPNSEGSTNPTPIPSGGIPTPPTPSPSTAKYDPNYDHNNDNKVNLQDVIQLIKFIFG
jgi:hypothetical protein